jgi:hypothetical protein
MPKFVCSYAYDVPCYTDFVVEAASEVEAENIIQAALRAGRFATVTAEPNDMDVDLDSQRVFVQGEDTGYGPSTTLQDLCLNDQCHEPNLV